MIARDSNGLECEVYQCGVKAVRDVYWNVYKLVDQTTFEETYSRLDGDDILTVERCRCEGTDDDPNVCPGVDINNIGETGPDGEQLLPCGTCSRYDSVEDAAGAYVAALNRIVGHQHFMVVYRKPRYLVGVLSAGVHDKWLTQAEIEAELLRFWKPDDTQPAPPVSDTDAGTLLGEH